MKIFICIFLTAILIGCGEKEDKKDVSVTVTRFGATEIYTKGYSEITWDNKKIRVPAELARVSNNGQFSIFMAWPEFIKPALINKDRADYHSLKDTIEIHIKPPKENRLFTIEDGVKIYLTRKENRDFSLNKLRRNAIESNEIPDFMEVKDSTTKISNYYFSKNNGVLDPSGLPILIYCDFEGLKEKDNLDYSRCGSVFYWEDGHSLHLVFNRKYLLDFEKNLYKSDWSERLSIYRWVNRGQTMISIS